MIEKRPFATGSKPGPDEIDHYLEQQGYYRKHIARDASSLFRVFAEDVFHIQSFHDKIRLDISYYIEDRRNKYGVEIDGNFQNYITNLRKCRTPGTLLELRVLAEYFKKNIILFEPNQLNSQTTERIYVNDTSYGEEPIRVFYSYKDKHFDLIYTMGEVEGLAESQSTVYNVLYSNVFQLPDVKFAVERMLHDQKGETTIPLPDDDSKYVTAHGEIEEFDKPEETKCVLKDPETCHFHNQDTFDDVVQKNLETRVLVNRSDDPGRLKVYKPVDGYLYAKDKSCVRQLLEENITPFPYKVAKALDPSIYRNTEFELWQDTRKEGRKWQEIESTKYFVHDSFTCPQPILEETYVIAGGEEDFKRKYAYPDEEKSMKKLEYFTGYNHFRPAPIEHIVMPMYNNPNQPQYRPRQGPRQFYNNNRGRHHINYVNPAPINHEDYIEHQPDMYNQQVPPMTTFQDGCNYVQTFVDPNSPPPVYHAQPAPYFQYVPQSPYPQQQVAYGHQPAYNQQAQYPNFSVPPPQIFTYPTNSPAAPLQTAAPKEANNNGDSLNLIRETELSASNINWNAKESTDSNGNDLPTTDTATLQFYYNVGVRYLQASGVRRIESVCQELEALTVQDAAPLQQNLGDSLKNDQPPPVPTNTPVTTKPPHSFGSGPPGNRSYYNHHNGRRPFNHQNSHSRDHGNGHKESNGYKRGNHFNVNKNNFSHKDIQFNSNVKNVHKVDSLVNRNEQENQAGNSNFQRINATSTAVAKDKTNNAQNQAAPLTTQAISPIAHENDQQPTQTNPTLPNLSIPPPNLQMATYAPAAHQPQYYQQYPVQAFVPQQQYAVNYEGGEVMPQYQPVPQQYQQVYYAPQTPVYYQQSPHPQILDQTASTNDSGVDTVNGYPQPYPPAYTQIVYPSPTQYYYTPQTPIIQQAPVQPVFQVAAPATNVECVNANPISSQPTDPVSPDSASPNSSPQNSDDPSPTEEA